MIFNRLLIQIKEQNWAVLGIELVVLVVGVFVGLQASNWNDDRVERAEERGYLVRLHEDIKASAAGIDTDNSFLAQQLSDQLVILNALSTCSIHEGGQPIIDRGFRSLGRINPPRLITRTYGELTASGKMDIIQSDEIKKELADIVAAVEFRQNVHTNVTQRVAHYRFIIEDQMQYNLSTAVEESRTGYAVGVSIDIAQFCQQPINAIAIGAVSAATNGRLSAFIVLHQGYIDILPLIENELLARWGYSITVAEG